MDVSTSFFVNRDEELEEIDKILAVLQDRQKLLRTPIIEYTGVQGIGKTTLLQQIEQRCSQHLLCKRKKAAHITEADFDTIDDHIQTKPYTLILDDLDEVPEDHEQFELLETRLSESLRTNMLFVVLASRSAKYFEGTRSISRTLKLYPLKPFQPKFCDEYLNHFPELQKEQMHSIIFKWTRGYPLALEQMTNIIVKRHLDPTKERDQKKILHPLIQEVIVKRLLAKAVGEERVRIQNILALLSLPRSFNLVLAKDLIEEFLPPAYKLENSLAYITIPKDINKITSALFWSSARAAYCIEEPIRNLFNLQYSIDNPQEYKKIHAFLATRNKIFMEQVPETERSRYLGEYLYHLACSGSSSEVKIGVTEGIHGLLSQPEGSSSPTFQQAPQNLLLLLEFYDLFQKDNLLQEALDQNIHYAFSVIYKKFLEIYRQLSEDSQATALKHFFEHITPNTDSNDFVVLFEEGMNTIIQKVSAEDAEDIYSALRQLPELRAALGDRFDEIDGRVAALVTRNVKDAEQR